MELSKSNAWKDFFEAKGLRGELSEQYLNYVNGLISNSCPVIFEIEHLSTLLGLKPSVLNKMINSTPSFYREFTIPKKRGGRRVISSPYPSLLHVQKWIYKNILIGQEVHPAAHGFVENKSIATHAKNHLNKSSLLKMDIENFFPSIPINWVINLFKQLGYADNIAYYLSRLCCLNSSLTQGSPTSPVISNLLLRQLDKRLELISNDFNLMYTRYADDLVFSGDYVSSNFKEAVEDIIKDFGLRLNSSKTYLSTNKSKRIVTGLSVSGNKIRLPRKYKRKLKQEIFFIKKYGVLSHVSKKKIRNPNYVNSLIGKFTYWHYIEPNEKLPLDAINYLRSIQK